MAYGVKSQKFLCCLSVRLGALVLSFLHFLIYGFLAVLLWVGLGLKDAHLDKREKISVILAGISCSIRTIISIIGLFGAIKRSLSLVRKFSNYLIILFGLSLGVAIYNIVVVLTKDRDDFIRQCIDGRTEQDIIDTCHHITTLRFVVVGLFVVSWLINLYECIIFARYVWQLEEEKQEKHHFKPLNASMYDTVPGRPSTEAFPVQFHDDGGFGKPGGVDARGEVKLYGGGPYDAV